MSLTFSRLTATNTSRANRWHKGGIHDWSPERWMTATLGELGEAANALKKLFRIEDGPVMSILDNEGHDPNGLGNQRAALEVPIKIEDVPTERLATNFVCSLIKAKGDINRYQMLTELLIRELRNEPHPQLVNAAEREE